MRKLERPQDRDTDSYMRRQRAWNAVPPEPSLVLGIITGSVAISPGTAFRWEYTWTEATINGSTPLAKTDGLATQTAYSVSELSNVPAPSYYSYGVPSGDLPATFTPKVIPNGTFVILSSFRRSDGSLLWLIINTQAISGQCP